MKKTHLPFLLWTSGLIAGCSQEQPVRSVQEFLDNPQFLEAAVVRCSQNRTETRYDAECINARQAVSLIEAREERARRDRLEAESESKRAALRRTRRVAAEARRHAAEQEQLRKEAEYLAQFGEVPAAGNTTDAGPSDNVPGAQLAPADQPPVSGAATPQPESPPVVFDEPLRDEVGARTATDGGNAPAIVQPAETDLDAVRDELRRRQDEQARR